MDDQLPAYVPVEQRLLLQTSTTEGFRLVLACGARCRYWKLLKVSAKLIHDDLGALLLRYRLRRLSLHARQQNEVRLQHEYS